MCQQRSHTRRYGALVEGYLDAVSRPLKCVEDPPVLREIRGILRKGDREDYRRHLIEKYR